jgi:hypothetical protein
MINLSTLGLTPRHTDWLAVGRNVTFTLPMVTLKISPCTKVTLTFHFDFALDHPFHGDMSEGALHPRRRSNCQTKKLKSGYGPHWGPGTKTNWPTDRRSQCNLLNLHHCTENYRLVLSSEREPYMKNKESNCHSNKCNMWSLTPKGAGHQDELADWPSVVMWLRLRLHPVWPSPVMWLWQYQMRQ